jgi:hypothetical protein
MKNRYLEKKKKLFVIASMGSQYLMRKNNVYYFVDDIEIALKFKSRNMAKEYVNYYKSDLGDGALEVVIVPLEVSYELIDESIDENNDGIKH